MVISGSLFSSQWRSLHSHNCSFCNSFPGLEVSFCSALLEFNMFTSPLFLTYLCHIHAKAQAMGSPTYCQLSLWEWEAASASLTLGPGEQATLRRRKERGDWINSSPPGNCCFVRFTFIWTIPLHAGITGWLGGSCAHGQNMLIKVQTSLKSCCPSQLVKFRCQEDCVGIPVHMHRDTLNTSTDFLVSLMHLLQQFIFRLVTPAIFLSFQVSFLFWTQTLTCFNPIVLADLC